MSSAFGGVQFRTGSRQVSSRCKVTPAVGEGHDRTLPPASLRYGPIAAEAGAGAQMAVLMVEDRADRTALNLYAAGDHEFGPDSVELAEVFASHAAVAPDVVHTVGSLSRLGSHPSPECGQAPASRRLRLLASTDRLLIA